MAAQVWHVTGDRQLADSVDIARGFWEYSLGVIPKQPLDDGYALVFDFDTVGRHGVHMLGVRQPLDAIWLENGEVTAAERLRPWVSWKRRLGDTIIELPAGAAADVTAGDLVRVEGAG